MKLLINQVPNGLFNLIKDDQDGTSCLLQDTLENCVSLLKKTIKEYVPSEDVQYSYDTATHLVLDYTNGKVTSKNAEDFVNK